MQTLARHSTPNLTMNVYAKNRNERLSELAEKIGETVLFEPKCAKSVPSKPVESIEAERKLLEHKPLAAENENGGGGIRTPVPRCFKISIYMLSRFIAFSLCQTPNDRLLTRLFRRVLTLPARTTGSASLLCDALTRPTGKIGQDGLPN